MAGKGWLLLQAILAEVGAALTFKESSATEAIRRTEGPYLL